MSMYAAYLAERVGDQIVETDKGFATYRFPDEKTVYVLDVYVLPDFRRQRVASDLLDIIMGIAKGRKCERMLVSAIPSTTGSTDSLKAILGYGFRLDSSTNNYILFSREIV